MEYSDKFIDNQRRLNLHKNQERIRECRGRIKRAYLIHIPSESVLIQKIIMTMTKGRSQY